MEHRNEKGKLHRTDGPAVEDTDGYREWFVDGKRHRVDGPAVEDTDGTREWWINGKLHRVDGPAVEDTDGYRAWWVDGEFIKSEKVGERKHKHEMTNYKELREATTELLKAIDGLFPTDGPVKARVRAALKEKE